MHFRKGIVLEVIPADILTLIQRRQKMVIRMATTVEMEGAMMRTEVVDWISPRRTREDAKGVLVVVVVVVEAVIKEEAKVETEVDMMKRVTVIERS